MLLPKPAASRYCICIHYGARTINPDLGVSGVGNLSKEAQHIFPEVSQAAGNESFSFSSSAHGSPHKFCQCVMAMQL